MTKVVQCRNLLIGGGNPISIQSMTNVNPEDPKALLKQIEDLEKAGCDIVRLAVPNVESAKAFGKVREKTNMPLVADIHFDHRLALLAIDNGADKIRINPGNIGSESKVKEVVNRAKANNIPIRVGVNSGSLEKDILAKYGKVTAEGLCQSAIRNLRLIEDMGYDNLVVSLKSSDLVMNYKAHKLIAEKTDHPIHIGVTEAGIASLGKLKSSIGLGALLLEGIGDTMRVSLTADPVEEVIFAKELLEAVGLREKKLDIVSCPTCGRTEIALENLATQVNHALEKMSFNKPLKIAVMGCAVNGPGEAKEADYGIAGGRGEAIIFRKGQVLEKVKEERIVDRLIEVILENEGIN